MAEDNMDVDMDIDLGDLEEEVEMANSESDNVAHILGVPSRVITMTDQCIAFTEYDTCEWSLNAFRERSRTRAWESAR